MIWITSRSSSSPYFSNHSASIEFHRIYIQNCAGSFKHFLSMSNQLFLFMSVISVMFTPYCKLCIYIQEGGS